MFAVDVIAILLNVNGTGIAFVVLAVDVIFITAIDNASTTGRTLWQTELVPPL